MLSRGLFSILFVISLLPIKAGTIVLEGKYQGRSLYVQNGFAGSGVGFCSYQVSINGRVCTDEINSCAYEIDFSQFEIKIGDPVTIEIKHKDDCKPQILNPDALRPKPTFDVETIAISRDGTLKWRTANEQGSLPFVIEQYRWNKWVVVGETKGIGTPDINEYAFKTSLHSGSNKFRVKQTGLDGKSRYSKEIIYNSTLPELTFTSSKGNRSIFFSGETLFEIYDLYGNVVKRGFGRDIDMTSLKKGSYFLCYDNTTISIKKK